MGGSPGRISVKEIIGFYPYGQEFPHQGSHRVRIVIYPFEQDRLAPQGNSRVGQSVAGQGGLRRDFNGVIEMDIHEKGMEFPK